MAAPLEATLTPAEFETLKRAKFLVPTRMWDGTIEFRLTHAARILLGQMRPAQEKETVTK